MTRTLRVGVVALGLLAAAGAEARAVDEKKIDQAVERGVTALRRMQRDDGSWPTIEVGGTALAGLTLLECGVKPDDPAVRRAADVVRRNSVGCTHTYTLALSILFLDRLGLEGDVPLIESMTVRLLAGQNATDGGWSYNCPGIAEGEIQRLTTLLKRQNELVGGREPPKAPKRRRKTEDLPKEIREQLTQLSKFTPAGNISGSDNSNTQFATLALWVARRHGLPVGDALAKIDKRFRGTQNANGGWGYAGAGFHESTGSMTCAGLLGLAVAYGSKAEARGKGRDGPDLKKDVAMRAALMALGSVIDYPVGKRRARALPVAVPRVGGRTFYFLWSLERVCMALGLETIGKKDWYAWGCEVLLANQFPDGTWRGEHWMGGPDTCFALLFLRRANLATDLTAHFRGKLDRAGEAVLKAGRGDPMPEGRITRPAIDPPGTRTRPSGGGKPRTIDREPPAPITKERPAQREESEASRTADDLVRAPASRQGPLLERLRDGKGAEYTDALAGAIPQLEGDARRKAREALADRLTRMKPDTLARYLKDEDAEVRRAAALACALKDLKGSAPHLIRLLSDKESMVVQAARAALKELSGGQDFGPAPKAGRAERARAIAAWQVWWSQQGPN